MNYSKLLDQYPLIISTFAFMYGAIMRDPIWLIGFVASILSMLANRGMKVLSIKMTESYPETKPILNRPGTDKPGMPSGHAQVSAAFVVFLILWFYFIERPTGVPQGANVMILMATITGFIIMENHSLKQHQTNFQIIMGALIGGLLTISVLYPTLKYLPFTKARWSVPAPTMLQLTGMVMVPVVVYIVGNYLVENVLGWKEVEEDTGK
jgi:hypothetical protein